MFTKRKLRQGLLGSLGRFGAYFCVGPAPWVQGERVKEQVRNLDRSDVIFPLHLIGKGATQTRSMNGNKIHLRPDLSGVHVEKGLSHTESPSP